MKKMSATFSFSEKYQHVSGTEQSVSVQLYIDYQSNTFSVYPHNSDNFKFKEASQHYKMWMAVLNCIREAIEFGSDQIKLNQL